ncbi:MAG TPA: glycosyltransferase [Ramlibacter sp.]|nr:glycosyltransferase [Ramlibacter sp.]
MSIEEPIRVYVGADRSQELAVAVLEYSIKRHTTAPVQVIPMVDLEVPVPIDPRNSQRTGFSFSRFCIPQLAGYRGRAIYMDADMQVFQDIRSLWELPFDGCKVLVQQSVKHVDETLRKENAPAARKKQCAVMLLDCGRLDWDVKAIVRGMDEERYSYAQLMDELCILPEDQVGYRVPFEWNSLEHYDSGTCLIHYTDMGTQPWVSTRNPNGHLWFAEVRRMLGDGSLTWDRVRQEIALGYFRPSLVRDLRWGPLVPRFLQPWFNRVNEGIDKASGFVAHRKVYEVKRLRNEAVRAYEKALAARQKQAAAADLGEPAAERKVAVKA